MSVKVKCNDCNYQERASTKELGQTFAKQHRMAYPGHQLEVEEQIANWLRLLYNEAKGRILPLSNREIRS